MAAPTMAPINVAHSFNSSNYDQSLHSASLELKYERSSHLVDIISKDESMRKMRFDMHVLEDSNEELRDLLTQEEDRSESLEKLVHDHLQRAEDAETHVFNLEQDLQSAEQDLSVLRAEAKALHNVTTDSEKLLTEKLDLGRQLSTMKPELDHLRQQVDANQQLLTENLSLQRQLSEIQIQLEHAKSEAKRAIAKRRNTQHDEVQQDTIDDLRKALTREKRLREKAQQDLESLQADLEQEKESAQRRTNTEATNAEQHANTQVETEELRRQLAKERKDREKAEKTYQKTQSDWNATKAILDDKLNQFRTKLKSTKERLNDAEIQLQEAHQSAAAADVAKPKPVADKPAKQTKKRNAAQMDPDSQKLGTPGNAKPAKRGRKAAAVGDKSTFSITPFLNRTLSVAPESPAEEEAAPTADAAQDSESEVEDEPESPSAVVIKPTVETAPKPLAQVPASKTNIRKEPKAKKQKLPLKQSLEQVVEEIEPASQQATTKVPTFKPKTKAAGADAKPKAKQRKSLATFAAFAHEPEPEKKQKKRKLGGLGKTLFDDEDDAPSKPMPGRGGGLFASTRLGPLAGGGVRGSFIAGAGKKKSGLLTADDGFMFSPLKKEKKLMASFIQ